MKCQLIDLLCIVHKYSMAYFSLWTRHKIDDRSLNRSSGSTMGGVPRKEWCLISEVPINGIIICTYV